MKEYFAVLEKCALFCGITPQELEAMLCCLDVKTRDYTKNQTIMSEGTKALHIGIVLSGEVDIIKEDYFGNRNIVTSVGEAEMFAEAFALSGTELMPVSAVAKSDCRIMLADCKKMISTCTNSCGFHNKLIENLLLATARKNLILNRKLEILSKRTIREKLMTYLLSEAKRKGSDTFTIPFDRQSLADYIGAERSAMSAEISKMQKERLIISDRSRFTILRH